MQLPKVKRPKRSASQRLGPYSKPATILSLDGRTREAKFMCRLRERLTAHVGGHPSFVEQALIERAVRLSLRLELMDRCLANGEQQTTHDQNYYLAWSNALARLLERFGKRPRGEVPRAVVFSRPENAVEEITAEDFLGSFVEDADVLPPRRTKPTRSEPTSTRPPTRKEAEATYALLGRR